MAKKHVQTGSKLAQAASTVQGQETLPRIKKAAEYAAEWMQGGKSPALLKKIVYDFIGETATICRARGIADYKPPRRPAPPKRFWGPFSPSPRPIILDPRVSVIRETDAKWRAFVNRIPAEDGVKPEGFRYMMCITFGFDKSTHDEVWPAKSFPTPEELGRKPKEKPEAKLPAQQSSEEVRPEFQSQSVAESDNDPRTWSAERKMNALASLMMIGMAHDCAMQESGQSTDET